MAQLDDLVVRKGDVAVVFYDGIGETKMTYDELHQTADTIAVALGRSSNCDGQAVIGIFMEMSVLVPACILGILKASCCFVYLSPSESTSYLRRIIDRADVQCIIADPNLMIRLRQFVDIESDQPPFSSQLRIVKVAIPGVNGTMKNGSDGYPDPLPALAYIMFTSGTTGESKMVRVPHSCIVPNILHLWNEYKISSADVIFLSSPLTFDPSIVDVFLALSTGATLLIVSDSIKAQPEMLADVLFKRFRISVLQTTPTLLLRFPASVLKRLLSPSWNESFGALRILALGGEPFPCQTLAPYLCQDENFLGRDRLRMYNLYGPTEVSCWSMCHRVRPWEVRSGAVPIGRRMLGTEVRLADPNGRHVANTDVIGELCVGGASRYCFVDDDGKSERLRLRPTGDLAVRKTDEAGTVQWFLIGRADDHTKRMGKRLNLLQISQLVETNVNVKTCAVILDDQCALRAFVQLQQVSVEQNIAQSVIAEVRQVLQKSLPSHCQPDHFHVVDMMPTTKHGKIDKKALLGVVDSRRIGWKLPKFSMETVEDSLRILLKDFIPDGQTDFTSETSFRLLGIDSLKAVALTSALEEWIGVAFPNAVEIILTGTISGLLQYLRSAAAAAQATSSGQHVVNGKSKPDPFSSSTPAKRSKIEIDGVPLRIVEKCGRIRWTMDGGGETNGMLSLDGPGERIRVNWKWDSRKCIDASPVMVENLISGQSQVFIGSHSGKFACLDADKGVIVWMNQLGDRIEASAMITGCARYVVVGCYDGGVYFFGRSSGQQWWKFQTGDAVKCTGCVDGFAKLYIGSHDRRFYKLDHQERQCDWSVDLGSAILSSPALNSDGQRVFVACLQGIIYCMETADGTKLWRRQLSKPVFSSLLVSGNGEIIAVGVDGLINWLSPMDGSLIRQFHADGQIFSTPTYVRTRPLNEAPIAYVLFGCENGRACCIRETDLEIVWTREFDCPVSSSAFPFEATITDEKRTMICLVTNRGVLHMLRLDNGETLIQHRFGAEIFSSPIVIGNRVFVGCRDDSLYCLKME